MPWKPSDTDPRTFRVGQSWLLVPLGGPDDDLWLQEPADSPLATFVLVFSWLSWAARGAPMMVVTAIDRERGIITLDSWSPACDTSGDG